MDTKVVTLNLTMDEASIVLAGVTFFERDKYLADDVRSAATKLRKSIWQTISNAK